MFSLSILLIIKELKSVQRLNQAIPTNLILFDKVTNFLKTYSPQVKEITGSFPLIIRPTHATKIDPIPAEKCTQ
jgi:hypothetical protein